jgi:hypothetical protein
MIKATFGILSAAAVILLATSFSNVSAQTKAPRPPACSTLKDEFACRGRDDCQWNAAVLDTKSGKEKRKASCGPKPKAKKK